jgi:hypothetical protein
VASCTAGLTLALAALPRRSLEAAFVDIDSAHWHLDPEALTAALLQGSMPQT